jgi:Na+/melibiose symporter-like transporter
MSIEDNPKAALAAYISELENDYQPWYESATVRNYWIWSIAQGTVIIAGLLTAVAAALATEESFKSFGFLRLILIVLPIIGTFAATFLVQTRVRDLFALRERGRQAIQRLVTKGRADFAAAIKPEEYTAIHLQLAKEVEEIEAAQTQSFFSAVPDLGSGKAKP